MRIQHNIMAMNAYRNYNTNTKALSGNLEKLSSGYKINRAGDDAAGLAISEKMRAQITGLDAAQKNVKDGISLVKTAEGAMQEIQDMLNRMDYLATQSANGTYDNPVDRANLQKEVENLKTEIDRIADSANFNGIKLLDGSQDPGATKAVEPKATWSDPTNIDDKIADAGTGHVTTGGTDSVLRTEGVTEQSPSFTIDLTDFKFTATDDGASFQITIGDENITVANSDKITGGSTAIDDGDTMTGAELAALLETEINGNDSGETIGTEKIGGIKIGDSVYTAKASGAVLTFSLSQTQDDGSDLTDKQEVVDTIPQGAVKISAATKGTTEGVDTISHGFENITAGVAETAGDEACAYISPSAGDIKDGTKLTIGNTTYTFAIGKDSQVDTAGANVIDMTDVKANDTDLLDKAIAQLTNQTNDWFTLSSPAAGKLVATAKGDDYKGDGDLKTIGGLKSNFSISQMTVSAGTAANAGDTTKGITLQIGDTSDAFNQMKITIGDMHVDAMGKGKLNEGTADEKNVTKSISEIDIGTQAGAQEAIDVIKNAINYVSGIRGDLGAAQNRLEHTGNNLSVMAENIQDAESTIRDTDVANEMMSYVKNNILVQSAQAMLAQANQVPQGVLQLLG